MKKFKLSSISLAVVTLVCACTSEEGGPDSTLQSGYIETIAGSGPEHFGYDGDGGPALSSKLGYITGIAVDKSGNIYITDGAANVVRKIVRQEGTITTLAGTFLGFNKTDATPFAGDGGTATSAHLNVPLSVAIDESTNVIIADAGNNLIRQVAASNGKIFTVAGQGGIPGYEGDGAAAIQSKLWNPYGVATDATGNIYIADSQNNCIRKINKTSGTISTIAGKGPSQPGYSGDDGLATAATLNAPQSIALDSDGNIFISDVGNNVIRKISITGIITTIAGKAGQSGYSGDNGKATEATFQSPKGLATDRDNNIYITDSGNNVVRMIRSTDGVIITIAGSGEAGYAGDGGPATSAKLSNPLGVALDNEGNIFIADAQNSVIRIVRK